MTLKELRDSLEEGDVVLTFNKKKWISRLIIKIIRCNYSHSIYIINNYYCIESTTGGCQQTSLDFYFNGTYDLAVVKPLQFSRNDIKRKTSFLRNKIGEKYSYIQLVVKGFRFLFNWSFPKDLNLKASTCSELIAEADKRLFNLEVKEGYQYWNTAPKDFLNSKIYKLHKEISV